MNLCPRKWLRVLAKIGGVIGIMLMAIFGGLFGSCIAMGSSPAELSWDDVELLILWFPEIVILALFLGGCWWMSRSENVWFYLFFVVLGGMLSHGYAYFMIAIRASA